MADSHDILSELRVEAGDRLEQVTNLVPNGDGHRQGGGTIQANHFATLQVQFLDAGDRIFDDLVVLRRATKPDLEGGGGGIAVDANVVCVHFFRTLQGNAYFNISRTQQVFMAPFR